MVDYTITVSEDCLNYEVIVDGVFESDNYLTDMNTSTSVDFDFEVVGQTTVFTFQCEVDTVLSLVLYDNQENIKLLLNYRHLRLGNRLNKYDVDELIAKRLKNRYSETIDALNRVVIANFRLGLYTKAIEGLNLVDSNNEENIC